MTRRTTRRTLTTVVLAAALALTPAAWAAASGTDTRARASGADHTDEAGSGNPERGRARGTTYYVDCARGSDGASGTRPGRAWRTLEKAASVTYRPGDSVRFQRGTRCEGSFAPRGSGTERAPVTAGAYGSGAKPEIAGGGARAAVLLENVEGWELRDLAVSNKGPRTTTERRAGILVRLNDFGTGRHYVVEDVDVREVNGADFKDPDPSGGILFVVSGQGEPTAFDGVTVEDSTVTRVDRTGIGTNSSWGRRAAYPDGPGRSFEPFTNVVVRGNTVRDVGGDGIVTHNSVGALVEHNLVDGFNRRSAGYNAGVWSWNSDEVVTQFNEVTGGHGTRDSQAFDIDGGNNRNLFQYNHSHDNEGGFLLLCNGEGMTSDSNTVRYNVSVNDQNRTAPYGVVSVVCGPTTNTLVHNNTLSTTAEGTPMVNGNGPGGVTFRNNVFAGAPGGSSFEDTPNTFDHNLYFRIPRIPADDAGAVEGDPLFAGGTAPRSPADLRLRTGSPALGAGTPVPEDGGRDYFGRRVTDPPSIGAHQGTPHDTRRPPHDD